MTLVQQLFKPKRNLFWVFGIALWFCGVALIGLWFVYGSPSTEEIVRESLNAGSSATEALALATVMKLIPPNWVMGIIAAVFGVVLLGLAVVERRADF